MLRPQVSQTTTLFMAEKNKTVSNHLLSAQGISAAALQQSSMREMVEVSTVDTFVKRRLTLI